MAHGRRPSSFNPLPVDSRDPIELIIRADDLVPYGVPAWLKEQQHQVARRTKSLYIELDSERLRGPKSRSPRQFLLKNSFKALEKLVISRAYNEENEESVQGYGEESEDDSDDADSSVGLDFDLVEAKSLRTLIVEGIELSGGDKDPIHIEMLSLSRASMEWRLFASLLQGSTELRTLKLHHSWIENAPSKWSVTLPWLRTLSIYKTHLRDLTVFLGSIQTLNLRDLDFQVHSVSPDDLEGFSKSLALLVRLPVRFRVCDYLTEFITLLQIVSNDSRMSLKIGGHFAFITEVLKAILSCDGDHNLQEVEIDSERRWPSDEIWRVHLGDTRDLINQLKLPVYGGISSLGY